MRFIRILILNIYLTLKYGRTDTVLIFFIDIEYPEILKRHTVMFIIID